MIKIIIKNKIYENFQIYYNDSVETIMKKIFYTFDYEENENTNIFLFYYPFLKLVLQKNNDFITLNDKEKSLYMYFDNNDFYNDVFIHVDNFIDTMYKVVVIDRNVINENYYESLKKDFPLLEKKFIKPVLNFITNLGLDKDLETEIKIDYSENSKITIKELNKTSLFYKKYSSSVFSPSDIQKINIERIEFKYTIPLEKIVKNTLFNVFEIDDKFQFIIYTTDEKIKKTKFSKDYEKYMNDTLKNIKKTKLRNIIIKYKIHEDNFVNITIKVSKNKIIVNFENIDENVTDYTFEKLKTKSNDIMIELLQKIRYSQRVDLYPDITDYKTNIETNFYIDKGSLKNISNAYFMKDILKENILSKSDEVLSLRFLGNIINVSNNKYRENSSIVTLIGDSKYYQNIFFLLKILKMIVGLSEYKKFNIEKQKIIEKSHTKALRSQGAIISSVNCQKNRQPDIIQEDLVLEKSYILSYEGKKYICNNPDYMYPGFTNKNIICCFKNDQRKRENFLKNIAEEKINNISAQSHSHLVKTDKLLNNGSVGTIDEILLQYFNKYKIDLVYRKGVIQNEYSFINALSECFEKITTDDIIENLNSFIETDFEKYPINNSKTYEEFINTLQRTKYNFKYLLDIVSDYLKINVFIINIPVSSNLSTEIYHYDLAELLNTNTSFNYEKSIILLKKQEFFEIIVKDKNEYIWNTSDEIISDFVKLTRQSRSNIYPKEYKYKPLPLFENIIEKYKNIGGVVINDFNQVLYIVLEKNDKNYIIPIEKTFIKNNFKIFKLEQIHKPTISEYEENTHVVIKQVIIDNEKNIIAGITEYGQKIPLKDVLKNTNKPISKQKYYTDIDKITIENLDNYENEQQKFSKQVSQVRSYVSQSVIDLSKYIKENNKYNDIMEITSMVISKNEKMKLLVDLLKSFKVLNNQDENLLGYISNYILNDSVANKIFNNVYNEDVKKTDNDIVLLSTTEIENYFKLLNIHD